MGMAIVCAAMTSWSAAHGAGTVGSDHAAAVWGQFGSFGTASVNSAGKCDGVSSAVPVVSACSLYYPLDAVVDSAGYLWVVDAGNNRVLVYPAGNTTATAV